MQYRMTVMSVLGRSSPDSMSRMIFFSAATLRPGSGVSSSASSSPALGIATLSAGATSSVQYSPAAMVGVVGL